MISFIIPIRGRKEQVEGCLDTIKNQGGQNYEILLIEQRNTEPFLRGQLCNLGFKKAKGDLVVFQDVDIRYLREMQFENWMKEFNRPYLPFDRIEELIPGKNGELRKITSKLRLRGFGACSIFTRDQFELSNGFSNLMIGWGGEDTLLNKRVGGFYRMKDMALGHIRHSVNRSFKTKQHTRNVSILRSDASRDQTLDSYRQTVGINLRESELGENARLLSFSEVSVSDDFAYKDLLPGNG